MTTIGTVHLNVANLDRQIAFYQERIGLKLHHREGSKATIGTGKNELLVLTETPGYKRDPHTTGLYHFAILVPSRFALGQAFIHLLETQTPLQGASDHIVSEALYLADPEGNGIEIYRDRPREQWYKDGEMQLATLPMDAEGVLNEARGKSYEWKGLPEDTIMGHIHLHVSQIGESDDFYSGLLGLDTLFNMGSALFMSYDGYHHHIGANIWGGRRLPAEPKLGLDHFDLHVGSQDKLDAIVSRLDDANVPVTANDEAYMVSDPSKNVIWLRV